MDCLFFLPSRSAWLELMSLFPVESDGFDEDLKLFEVDVLPRRFLLEGDD